MINYCSTFSLNAGVFVSDSRAVLIVVYAFTKDTEMGAIYKLCYKSKKLTNDGQLCTLTAFAQDNFSLLCTSVPSKGLKSPSTEHRH